MNPNNNNMNELLNKNPKITINRSILYNPTHDIFVLILKI